jgi:hypothetical protein
MIVSVLVLVEIVAQLPTVFATQIAVDISEHILNTLFVIFQMEKKHQITQQNLWISTVITLESQ